MAHSDNLIHSVKINGTTYEIHDAQAIHTLADLAALGIDVEGAFIFKGTVATVADLPTTGNKIGYVYHVTANHSEYVWALVDGGTAEGWEEFGEHFVINHAHTVTVTGENASSAVTGSATVTGGNSTSSVSGSASIANVPKVSAAAKYAKVSTGNDSFVKSYPGATSKLVTTSVKPAGDATAVIASLTPATASVTGVSGSTTASKATAGTAVAVAKAGTAVSIPNVTGNTTVTASKVTKKTVVTGASVTDGVLTISFGDSVTATDVTATNTTLGSAISVTPAVSNGSITPYSFSDVTVPKAASAASTFLTGVTPTTTDVATVGAAITLATGALASNGAGSSVMTGLGTATTAKALTSASLAAGTSSDGIHTGDDVTVETQTLSGTISGTAAAQTWTQNTGTVSGTAAAQTWTQKSGSTGNPQ